MRDKKPREFLSLSIAVLTVSDTRDMQSDVSGSVLVTALQDYGHMLADRRICKDNVYAIRAQVSAWIADPTVQVIILTGGTGLFDSDVSPEAVRRLFDKTIDGFGELFRALSYQEIGSSAIQSRVVAGIANKTLIFVLPGSTNACKLGWSIISEQLDASKTSCNFVNVLTLKAKNAGGGEAIQS